jgi:transcriptional regulator with XRE-family HTH domain
MSLAADLVSEHEAERVKMLELLAGTLRSFNGVEDREAFSRLFHAAQTILEFDDLELARALRVSRPTVSRWTRGESAPHPLGREPALRLLADMADAKLRRHKNDRYRDAPSLQIA